MMRVIRTGVTRTVILTRLWAIKIAIGRRDHRGHPRILRAIIANRSEWHQRDRTDVARPAWTIAYLIQCYPKANYVPHWTQPGPWDAPRDPEGHNDELKASSWGRFGDRWLLIDYDRGYSERDWLIGKLYYGHQERLARKWMKLTNEPEAA